MLAGCDLIWFARGGSVGFEKANYDISQNLAGRVLLPAARAANKNTTLVMNGFSCREQIKQNTDLRAVHLAEVLAGKEFSRL